MAKALKNAEQMRIVTVPVDSIKVNPNNPRIIKDDKFKKLVQSIKDLPQMLSIRPIVVNADMVVLGGNMRLKACKEAGMKEVPIIIADNLTEEQQREFLIKDNVSGGEWDWSLLQSEWDVEQLNEWGLDIPDFAVTELEAVEDDYEIPDEIQTDIVLGDLFEIGVHRLLCGDSTDSDAVARLMDGEKADMVFTDPPYGIAYSSERFENVKAQSDGLKRNKAEMIAGDEKPFDPSSILTHSANVKEVFIWGYQYYPEKLGRGGIVVWNKKTESQADCAHGDFEICFSKQERNRMFWHTWGGFKNKETGEDRLHTTQKPVALPSFFFNEWGNDGELVVDYFLGSGTTMVAAHQLNRKCYGMELDSKYCEVIVTRMIKLDNTLTIKRNGVDETKKWLEKLA